MITGTEDKGPLGYMPQLDGLRAIAVGLVLVGHFLPGANAGFIPLAWVGVQLFFVLSGFLITRIVLLQRRKIEERLATAAHSIKTFYFRRFLRLTPLYYLVIFLALIFDVEGGRQLWPYLVCYLTNVKMAIIQDWVGEFSHLWSLAAEEQFYLIWPWLILFLRKKQLPYVLVVGILAAVLFRVSMVLLGMSIFSNLLLFGVTDALGAGALLAVVVSGPELSDVSKTLRRHFFKWLPLAALVGLVGALVVFHQTYQNEWASPLFSIWAALFCSVFFTWIVWLCSNGLRGPLGWVLSSRGFVYVGRISYGIYIIHVFVPQMLINLHINPSALPAEFQAWFLLNVATTVGLASASWFLLERPIKKLKNKFSY